tara:strand:+ start:5199 stop:5714 length:516 start_codon:yes stop_codon:yes gene_type:complete
MNNSNNNDFWNDWGTSMAPRTPIPPGRYLVRMNHATLDYGNNAEARTSMEFVIQEGEHVGRYIWFDYPHKFNDQGRAMFGWAAKMMYEACGLEGRPPGDTQEAVLLTIARIISDHAGTHFYVTTDVRTYKNQHGENVSKTRVKRVESTRSVNTQAAENANITAPNGEAPQW